MSVLLLPDAKTHLNITVATYDAELQDTIDAAERAIENRVGPLAPRPVTSRVPGGGALLLPVTPVVSLTSVTSVGRYPTALVVADLLLDREAGVVTGPARFAASSYEVTYSAGWSVLPDDLLQAVKQMLRHLWESQRRSSSRPGSSSPESAPAPTYLIPNVVAQLLEPYMLPAVG